MKKGQGGWMVVSVAAIDSPYLQKKTVTMSMDRSKILVVRVVKGPYLDKARRNHHHYYQE